MSRLKDIPELARDGKNLGAVIQAVREVLQTFRGYRGDPLDEALTLRSATSIGILNADGTPALATGSVGPAGPIGPAGPSGATYTPDLTAPPTPTGLAVTAGLTSIFVECAAPAYTEGHGHDRTVVYGAKWPSGAAPTFSAAVELFHFQGTFAAYPTETGTRWCIWIKWQSVDGVLSASPAGGTNGVQATTGLIGNIDLGPLIIEAANLAANSVTAIKFESSIQPVTVVSGVPGTRSTDTIYDTATRKLYRWSGTAYVSTVPTTDLSGTIADAQIAALAASKVTGTLSDSQLAAISAAKVTGTLTNSQIADLAATKITGQITTTQITDNAVTTAKVNAGAIVAGKIAANAVTATEIASGSITTAKIAAGAVTATEVAAGAIVAGKIAANAVTATEIAAGTITGAKIAAGTIAAGNIVSGTITSTQIAAGAITATEIAANTITAAKIFANTITAGEIATGAITATKIAANAIAVGTAAIQNGAIINAMIGDATIDSAKIASLSASKLTVGDGTIGGNLKSTVFTSGSAGWLIQPNGSVEFNDAVVRGTIYSGAGLIGGVTIATAAIRAGQTAFDTGTGFFLGSDGKFSVGTSGSKLTWDGTVLNIIGGGTFSGALSAATGSFAGSLTAATGSFAGSLTAATGSFAGSLSAATGSFAGSLSAATGTFAGTLTAAAVNAVNTINIASNAVSVVNSASGTGTTVSTTLVIPANQTMKVVAVGHVAGQTPTSATPIYGSVTVTIDGTATTSTIGSGATPDGGPDGGVSWGIGAGTIINLLSVAGGAGGKTITVSVSGGASGVNKIITAIGTLR